VTIAEEVSPILTQISSGTYVFDGSGSIAGTGSLSMSSSGTLTINNANTYSGGTSITNGTLILGNSNALGSGSVTISSGAKLSLSDSNLSFSNALAGSGTVEISGGANLTLNNDISAWNGTVDVTGSSTLTTSWGYSSINGTATDNNADLPKQIINVEKGSTLVKQGTTTLLLSQSSTLAGNIVVEGGAVWIGDYSRTSINYGTSTSIITLKNGTTLRVFGGGALHTIASSLKLGESSSDNVTVYWCDASENGTTTPQYTFTGNVEVNGNVLLTNHTDTKWAKYLDFQGKITGSGTLTYQRPDGNRTFNYYGKLTLSGDTSGFTGTVVLDAATIGYSAGYDLSKSLEHATVQLKSGTTTNAYAYLNVLANAKIANLVANENSLVGSIGDSYTLTLDQGNIEGTVVDNSYYLLNPGGGTDSTPSRATGSTLALTKTGTGDLKLTNASNSYSGGTTLQGGTITISNAAALGTGAITFDGGTLSVTSSTTLSQKIENANSNAINLNLANGVELTLTNTTPNLSADYNITGATDGSGSVELTNITKNKDNAVLTGHLSVAEGYTLTLTNETDGYEIGVASSLKDIKGTLAKSGDSNSDLLIKATYNNDTLTGTLSNKSGMIRFSGYGASADNNKTVIVTGKLDTPKIQLQAGAVLDLQSEQNLATIEMADGTTTKVSANGSLASTTISGGTLDLNGGTLKGVSGGTTVSSATTLSAASTIDVSAGNVTFSGGLTGSSNLTVSGSNTLTVGSNDTVGTLTLADNSIIDINGTGIGTLSLTDVTGSGTFAINLGTSKQADKIVASNYSGSKVSMNITVTEAGTFTVFEGASSITDWEFNFTNLGRGYTATTSLSSNNVIVTIAGDGYIDLVWNGTGDKWQASDTLTDWSLKDGTTNQYFATGDSVTFDDTATSNKDVTISGAVSPNSILVNSSSNYSFSADSSVEGSGITGASTLTKQGTGTLTINNSNSFKGGTTIEKGTISIATSDSLGTGDITFAGGTLSASETFKLTNKIAVYTPDGSTASTVNLSAASGKTLTVDLANSDAAALAFAYSTSGNVTLVMPSADATFSGALTVAEGSILTLQGYQASDTLNVSSALTGITGTLATSSISTLTLKGQSGDFAGTLDLNNAALVVSGATLNVTGTIEDLSDLSLTNTSTLTLSKATTLTKLNIGSGSTLNMDADLTTAQLGGEGSLNIGTNKLTATAAITSDVALTVGTGAIIDTGAYKVSLSKAIAKVNPSKLVSITKQGTGALELTGETTTIDSVNVSAGDLTLNGGSLTTNVLTLAANSTAEVDANSTLKIGSTTTSDGKIKVNGGTLASNAKALELGNAVELASGSVDTTDGDITLTGAVTGTGSVSVTGGKDLVLSGTSTTLGTVKLTASSDLKVTTNATIDSITMASGSTTTLSSGTLTTGSISDGTLDLAGGTLKAVANGTTVTSATTVSADSALNLTAGNITLGDLTGASKLTVTGTSVSSTTDSILDLTGTVDTTGELSLTNAQLKINGSDYGTLNLANLTTDGTSVVYIDFSKSGYDQIVTSDFSASKTINLTLSGTEDGTYDIFQNKGNTELTLEYFNVSADLARGLTLKTELVDSNKTLQVTISGSAQGALDLTWAGTTTDSVWSTADTNKNWEYEDEAQYFATTDNVTFDDDAKSKTVTISGQVSPGSVKVDSNSDYTFQVATDDTTSKIVDASETQKTTLTKDGSGSLNITNSNDYSGGTEIKASTISVSQNDSLGSGIITFAGGTLNAATDVTISNKVAVDGNNAVQLSADKGAELTLNVTAKDDTSDETALNYTASGEGTSTLALASGITSLSGDLSAAEGSTLKIKGNSSDLALTGSLADNKGKIELADLNSVSFTVSGTDDKSTVIGGTLDLNGVAMNVTGTGNLELAKAPEDLTSLSLGEGTTLSTTGDLDFSTATLSLYITDPDTAVITANSLTLSGATTTLTLTEAALAKLSSDQDNLITLTTGTLSFTDDYSSITLKNATNYVVTNVDKENGTITLSAGSSGDVYWVIDNATESKDASITKYDALDNFSAVYLGEKQTLSVELTGSPATDADGLQVKNLTGTGTSTLNVSNTGADNAVVLLINQTLVKEQTAEDGNETVTVAQGTNSLMEGSITGEDNVTFVKQGSGTLTVSGDVSIADTLQVEQGTIELNGETTSIENIVLNNTATTEAAEATVVIGSSAEVTTLSDNAGGTVSISDKGELTLTGESTLAKSSIEGTGTLAISTDTTTPDSSDAKLTLSDDSKLDVQTLKLTGATLAVAGTGADQYTVGTLTGDADSTIAIADDATLTVNGDGESSYSGSFDGKGTLAVENGSMELLGEGSKDLFLRVTNATVTLDASGSSSTSALRALRAASTSSDTISEYGIVLNKGAELIVGTSSATDQKLNVGDGGITLNNGSTLTFNLGTSSESELKALVPLATTTGAITLNSGSTLKLLNDNAIGDASAESIEITLMTGGSAATVGDVTFDAAFLETVYTNLTLLADGNDVVLKGEARNDNAFAPSATTPNATAGSNLLWDSRFKLGGPDSQLADVFSSVGSLVAAGDKAGATRAMAAVAGSTVNALGTAQRDALKSQLDLIRNRTTLMGVPQDYTYDDLPQVHMWIEGTASSAKLDSDGDEGGYKLTTWGGTVGFDVDLTEHFTFGAALSAQYGNLSASAAEYADGDLDSYYVSLFGRYQQNRWAHTLILTGAKNDASLDRYVEYGSGSYQTKGDTDGHGFGIMYEATYDVALNENKSAIFQPLFNASIVQTRMKGYSETGAGNAGLKVGKQDWTTGTLAIGGRWLGLVGTNVFGREALAELRANIAQDLGDDQGETDVAFTGNPKFSQTVYGAKVGKTAFQFGVGLSLPVGEQGTLFCNGNGEIRSGAHAISGALGYRYSF
jgi:autotransporter-associated beta strand protein